MAVFVGPNDPLPMSETTEWALGKISQANWAQEKLDRIRMYVETDSSPLAKSILAILEEE